MPNHRRASPAAAVPPPSPTGGHIPSGCRRAARVWRRRRFRQHLKPTDKPQTLCGVQGGAMANSLLYLLCTERWDEDRILTHLRRAGTLTTQRQARKGKERNRGSRSRRDEISPTTSSHSAKGNACRGFPNGFERLDGGRGALLGPLTTERCRSHPSTGFPNRATQSSARSPSPRIAI